MVMGELAEGTQVAIIGGGPAGYTCALRLARAGKQVTVIEKEGLGGLCLFHGCIPSKALIHVASAVDDFKHMGDEGVTAEIKIDWAKTQAWKAGVIKQLNSGIESLFKSAGVQIMRGTATFQSPRRILISDGEHASALEFEKAIIATGSTPRRLPEVGFDGVTVLSSREALALNEIPGSMAVFGGGYVGIEMATVFAKLGTKVTIIEHGARILPAADPDAAALAFKRLEELGVQFFFSSKAEKCEVANGHATVHFSNNGTTSGITADKVLVSIGHLPNTSGIGLEHSGVQLDEKGFIKVDGKMRTTNSDVFAIGDVAGHPMLAHKGYAQARVAAEVISGHDATYDGSVIPAVVFSDPEIASVGLQEHEAAKAGRSVIVGKFPFRALGRALASNKPSGFVKIIADPESHTVLGGTIAGSGAADLVAEIALAVRCGLMLEDIADTIHTHPTFPEAVGEAAEMALGTAVHMPKRK